jgi:hypothetical protein
VGRWACRTKEAGTETETGERIREALEALRAYTRFFALWGGGGEETGTCSSSIWRWVT